MTEGAEQSVSAVCLGDLEKTGGGMKRKNKLERATRRDLRQRRGFIWWRMSGQCRVL